MKASSSPLIISVYLPQFHPIKENDLWWGSGFTEWRNVAKAKPQFKGHYQPHLPGELGFYDLRVPEVRQQQANLATEYGIGGFCYYHYWFNGHQLLDRPLREVLQSGEPNFPFCMCWANENWTKAWNGLDKEIIKEQCYSQADDEAHIRSLIPYFSDPRYIRVNGKPLFIVYKADKLPNPQRTFDLWRKIARNSGIGELCLAQFESSGAQLAINPSTLGLDLSIEFSPVWRSMGGTLYSTYKTKIAMALGLVDKAYRAHLVYDYRLMSEAIMRRKAPDYPFLRCVCPGFDNTARRPEDSTIVINSSPEHYRQWLSHALDWTRRHNSGEHQVVFLNAWNEWAEGNHIEPDELHGRSYLEATRDALDHFNGTAK
jgi:lipopolysaccharide biosynthesis protein